MFVLQIIPNYLEMLSRESNKNLISGFPSVYILGGDSASLEESILRPLQNVDRYL